MKYEFVYYIDGNYRHISFDNVESAELFFTCLVRSNVKYIRIITKKNNR